MNYSIYKEMVYADFNRVKDFFPLLYICEPPLQSKEIAIYGNLIPNEIYKLTNDKNLQELSITINAKYPTKFPEQNLYNIRDVTRKINWETIPPEHIHRFGVDGLLCTYHPQGEINNEPMEERTVKILLSAYRLYYQYIYFIKHGEWIIDDLPHGSLADPILKKEGYL